MHHSRSTERPGMFRWHLWAQAPESPLCWLLGHKPQLTVVDSYAPRGRAPDPDKAWIKIDCARCGWRWHRLIDVASKMSQVRVRNREAFAAAEAEALAEHLDRLRRAREDPAGFLSGVMARDDVGSGVWDRPTNQFGVEAVYHPRYSKGKWSSPWHQGWGFKFHLGDKSSESPLHLNLYGHWWALYLSTSLGGRLARRIGGGYKRNLTLETVNGWLKWELWYDDEGGNTKHPHRCTAKDLWKKPTVWPWSLGREKYRPWKCLRNGHIDLNPHEALWGPLRPTDETIYESTVVVAVGDFHGDTYPVKVVLERRTWARQHGPWAGKPVDVTIGFEWDARDVGGIPTRNDSWKGDETLSSSETLHKQPPTNIALNDYLASMIVAQIRRDREHYGYCPPKLRVV